jgi:MYXO-CTERM domain-containing protein
MVAWIEQSTGTALEAGLHPLGESMTLLWGTTALQTLAAGDPFATDHSWEIVSPPIVGTATIDPGGRLTVTAPDRDGDDAVVVRAIDRADPSRAAEVRIELHYRETLDSGGCCSTGTPAASAGLSLAAVVAGLMRRRQR